MLRALMNSAMFGSVTSSSALAHRRWRQWVLLDCVIASLVFCEPSYGMDYGTAATRIRRSIGQHLMMQQFRDMAKLYRYSSTAMDRLLYDRAIKQSSLTKLEEVDLKQFIEAKRPWYQFSVKDQRVLRERIIDAHLALEPIKAQLDEMAQALVDRGGKSGLVGEFRLSRFPHWVLAETLGAKPFSDDILQLVYNRDSDRSMASLRTTRSVKVIPRKGPLWGFPLPAGHGLLIARRRFSQHHGTYLVDQFTSVNGRRLVRPEEVNTWRLVLGSASHPAFPQRPALPALPQEVASAIIASVAADPPEQPWMFEIHQLGDGVPRLTLLVGPDRPTISLDSINAEIDAEAAEEEE